MVVRAEATAAASTGCWQQQTIALLLGRLPQITVKLHIRAYIYGPWLGLLFCCVYGTSISTSWVNAVIVTCIILPDDS